MGDTDDEYVRNRPGRPCGRLPPAPTLKKIIIALTATYRNTGRSVRAHPTTATDHHQHINASTRVRTNAQWHTVRTIHHCNSSFWSPRVQLHAGRCQWSVSNTAGGSVFYTSVASLTLTEPDKSLVRTYSSMMASPLAKRRL